MNNSVSVRAQVPIVIRNGVEAVVVSFHHLSDEHVALIFKDGLSQPLPLVRVHSSCVTGDIFGSQRCDCGPQLNEAIHRMSQSGGVLLYLFQEGRGIGLYNKLDAYKLQIEQNLNTYEANRHKGFPEDGRHYEDAANMLKALGVHKIRLLSNNPLKGKALASLGIDVVETMSTETYATPHNKAYLEAKKNLAGHQLFLKQE